MGSRLKLSAFISAAVILIALAASLRMGAALNLLWLDEIWTLHLLEGVSSPLEIFTKIHHDNNHYLNTLALYLTGNNRPWLVYRLPAIAAGVLTVVASGWIASGRGRVAQLTVMTLIGTSYLLIHYSSEARGYSSAVLFALLAYETLRRFLDGRRSIWAAAFAASVVLGLLSHLMFVHVYGAAVYWSLASLLSKRTGGKQVTWDLLRIHGAPAALLGILYWADIRHLEFGGGPEYSLVPMVLQAGSLSLGGPLRGWLAWVCVVLLILGVASGCWLLQRTARDDLKFLLLVILLPILQIVLARPQFMFVRYFLFAIVFSLLLAAYGMAELVRCGRAGRLAYALLLFLFVTGNTLHYIRLVEHGRGQYLAALEFMSAADPAHRLTISGDHNHGIHKLLQFYSSYLQQPAQVVYYNANEWPAEGPRWLILHQYGDTVGDRFENVYVVEGHTYRRERVFDTAILSGWRWHCYRKQPG